MSGYLTLEAWEHKGRHYVRWTQEGRGDQRGETIETTFRCDADGGWSRRVGSRGPSGHWRRATPRQARLAARMHLRATGDD